jgi:arylformamidase
LLDIPFGSASGERLDFYPAPRPGSPLLVFIHGGWWRSLDKSDFTFIVPGYREAGFNVALTNYTLAPDASIEEITRQQLRALAWLYRNAARYDFDRDRIVVAGHSAGGHLAARMGCADQTVPVTRVMPISPLADLAPLMQTDMNASLAIDPAEADSESPARLALQAGVQAHGRAGPRRSRRRRRSHRQP